MKKTILLLFFALCLIQSISTQVIDNEYIIMSGAQDMEAEILELKRNYRTDMQYRILSKDLGILLVTAPEPRDQRLENQLSTSRNVQSWGYNYKTKKRLDPSDEYYDMQWGLELIDAPNAWEITTGGQDFYGNEIVVAVLDESFDINHPELIDQVFINSQEIPNDGIDNDSNGYIDDYQGWDTRSVSGVITVNSDNHGNAVSGIIGASGDNAEGISGVNWNVKILPITGINSQAEVIAGYQYVVDMRALYNSSNGEKGAFIVVSNYSAGIDGEFGTEPQYKSWCDMYDAMAEVGVLSCGATTNKNFDVDAGGDIPTTCPSEYLIAVTNVDIDDSKVASAGYGAVNIDLGAPGRGTLTLDIDGGYDQNFGGTSAATPHVAGTIALMYSAPCKAIADLSKTNPRQAVIEIRDAIFAGVDENTTLDGITATGGRLNIYNAIEKLQDVCTELELTSPKGELDITNISYVGSQLSINYLTPDESPYNLLITDRSGKTILNQEFTPPTVGRKLIETNLESAPAGIYFISIYNSTSIKTQKLIWE